MIVDIVRKDNDYDNDGVDRGRYPDWLFAAAIDVAIRHDWFDGGLSRDSLSTPSHFFREVVQLLGLRSVDDHSGTTKCGCLILEPYGLGPNPELDDLARRFADEFRCRLFLGEPSTWNPPHTTRYRFEVVFEPSRTANRIVDLSDAAELHFMRAERAERGQA